MTTETPTLPQLQIRPRTDQGQDLVEIAEVTTTAPRHFVFGRVLVVPAGCAEAAIAAIRARYGIKE